MNNEAFCPVSEVAVKVAQLCLAVSFAVIAVFPAVAAAATGFSATSCFRR